MGQSVVALMFGVKASDLNRDELSNDYGWLWDSLPSDERPDDAYEGDAIGFPVAVSGGYDEEDYDLGTTCFLDEITTVHAEGIADAKQRWEAFAAWFSANCKGELPKAGLLLTRDERA
jgi:hypothetical protein